MSARRRSTDSNIDVGTIGSRPCEVSLNRILIEHKNNAQMIHSVTSTLLRFRRWLKQLEHIPDPAYRSTAMKTYLDMFVVGVIKQNLPVFVESHTRCCLVTYYREAIGLSKE